MRKCDIISYLYQLIIGFYWVLLVSLYYLKKRGRKKKKKKKPAPHSQVQVLAWHCKSGLSVATSCLALTGNE